MPYLEGVRAEALGQTKLAFDDLVNQLYAGQDPPGVEEALESEHRAHAAFYPPVILFDEGLPAFLELWEVMYDQRRTVWRRR